jgi:hypothetical protein
MVSVALSADFPLLLELTAGVKTTVHCPLPPAAIELGLPATSEKSPALLPEKVAAPTPSAALEGFCKVTVFTAVHAPPTLVQTLELDATL